MAQGGLLYKRETFDELQEKLVESLPFRQVMAIAFVRESLLSEGTVRCLTPGETEAVLSDTLSLRSTLTETERAEIKSYYKALKAADKHRLEGKQGDYPHLTMDLLLQWHGQLLEGHEDGGKLRRGGVQTYRADGTLHLYPDANLLMYNLEGLMIMYDERAKTVKKPHEQVELSAWIMSELMTLHPFADGNGRLARIVGTYVLSKVLPFHLTPCPEYYEDRRARNKYLDAVEIDSKAYEEASEASEPPQYITSTALEKLLYERIDLACQEYHSFVTQVKKMDHYRRIVLKSGQSIAEREAYLRTLQFIPEGAKEQVVKLVKEAFAARKPHLNVKAEEKVFSISIFY